MRHAVAGIRKPTPVQERIVVSAILGLREEVSGDPSAELTSGAQVGVDTTAVEEGAKFFPFLRLTVPEGCPHNEDLVALGEFQGWEIYRVPWAGSKSATYLKRNGVTLSFADILHAFPHSPREEQRSGTWATIREARRRGIKVRFCPLDGSPPWVEPATSGHLFP